MNEAVRQADVLEPRSRIPAFDVETWRNMLDILREEPATKVIESDIPLPKEEDLEKGDYSGFADLPAPCQKALRRLARCSRMYLAGFTMIDDRTKDERDEWEKGMQLRYGDDFNRIYDWSKMRLNAMSKMINPLTFVADIIADNIKQKKSNGATKKSALLALDAKIPSSLVPPFETSAHHNKPDARVGTAPRYNELTVDEKLKVVAEMDVLAREFLALIERPSEKQ